MAIFGDPQPSVTEGIRRDAYTAGLSVGEAAARERLALWMIEHSFATGHGDTLEDMLGEMAGQIAEMRAKMAQG